MTRRLCFLCVFVFLLFTGIPMATHAQTLAETLSGRILLQVQAHGEAWYVDPVTKQRLYLGQPQDAYAIMRAKGLGIRHAELERDLWSHFPQRLAGRIVLDIELHGEAYYILPTTVRGIYLGRASDAFALMRHYGLGITDEQLATIPVAFASAISAQTTHTSDIVFGTLEQDAFARINAYRQSKGLALLTWDDTIANVARAHSQDMALGRVAFGHDGFTDRARLLQQHLSLTGVAENVAYNDYPDPALTSVNGWIASDGHRANIENGTYTKSGMGVAKSSDGAYYFTQLFIAP